MKSLSLDEWRYAHTHTHTAIFYWHVTTHSHIHVPVHTHTHSPELISVMLSIGNKTARTIWESRRPRYRPSPASPREERERFIKAKYIDKEFLADLSHSNRSLAEVRAVQPYSSALDVALSLWTVPKWVVRIKFQPSQVMCAEVKWNQRRYSLWCLLNET